jgi:hypothetical protein
VKEPSRNQVGTECGIESPIAHSTSSLGAGIDFSSRIRVLSLFQVNYLDIFIQEEAFPARNQFHGEINSSREISCKE